MCYMHFLVLCQEFEWKRQKLLRKIRDIEDLDACVGGVYKARQYWENVIGWEGCDLDRMV